MAAPTVVTAGPVTLTRVLYTDAVVPADLVGLTVAQALAVEWCDERWATPEGIRVGAAAWVASSGDRRVVIDPFRNADDILHDPGSAEDHRSAIADAFDAAGVPVADVTDVVLSHIEGLGMIAVARDDEWLPFFPNAQLRVGDTAIHDFQQHVGAESSHWSDDVWRDLLAAGVVEPFSDGDELAPGVRVEHTGAHNPGHYAIHFGDGPDVTFVGHLAVSPLHLSTGLCEPQHDDPRRAAELLDRYARDGRMLIGPLWPSPGAGRLVAGRFEPATGAGQGPDDLVGRTT